MIKSKAINRLIIYFFATTLFILNYTTVLAIHEKAMHFFSAENKNIQYTGRVAFTNGERPRFWQPGVYITARFEGASCSFIVNDEELWGKSHNYIEVVVDDTIFYRMQTKSKTDTISVAKNLQPGTHTIVICKNTEANIGYLEFVGFLCNKLLSLPVKPKRKLEFIGDSITCGTGSDQSQVPCGKGKWEDQHNAYMSYGPVAARKLNAQWHLSAVSGIGMIHSCCNMNVIMPQVYDKVSMRNDTILWNFNNYQPDAVTICLGQNDGIRDSAVFCSTYVKFIKTLRSYYPDAAIVCLTSPMADANLTPVLQKYLNRIVNYVNNNGDKKVYGFFFSKQYNNGCDGHPDLAQHQLIANKLSVFLSKLLNWKS